MHQILYEVRAKICSNMFSSVAILPHIIVLLLPTECNP